MSVVQAIPSHCQILKVQSWVLWICPDNMAPWWWPCWQHRWTFIIVVHKNSSQYASSNTNTINTRSFWKYSTQLTQPHFSVLRSLSDLRCVNQLSAPGPGLFKLGNLLMHFVSVVSMKRQSATWSCKEQRQLPLYRVLVAPNFPLADKCHQTLAVCVMHNHNIL